MAALKRYKPTTPGRRGMTVVPYRELLTTGNTPKKSLTKGKKNNSGRNAFGRTTSRFRGGSVKKTYRLIDFVYNKKDIPAKFETVEYDPYRSAFISLVCYNDGERRYVLSPKNIKVGETMIVSEKAEVKIGNRMALKNIPIGTSVFAVETKPNGGAVLARSAGNAIEVVAHDDGSVSIKMPSSEIRKVPENCFATIGQSSNEHHQLTNIGKAGRARHMGRRPRVRGTAMNPVDHPHGGGEGKAGRGRRRAISIFGKPTGKGQKTRTPKKYSNGSIVKRRKVKSNKNGT